MRIVIERSGRSFITHMAHIAMASLMIYGALTREDPIGYIISTMWIIVSYVRYNANVTLESELQHLRSHAMEGIRKDLKKFLKENKEYLINKIKEQEEE
jgi:hypothetical protein